MGVIQHQIGICHLKVAGYYDTIEETYEVFLALYYYVRVLMLLTLFCMHISSLSHWSEFYQHPSWMGSKKVTSCTSFSKLC